MTYARQTKKGDLVLGHEFLLSIPLFLCEYAHAQLLAGTRRRPDYTVLARQHHSMSKMMNYR